MLYRILLLLLITPALAAATHPPTRGPSPSLRPDPPPIHGIAEPRQREQPPRPTPAPKTAVQSDECTSNAIVALSGEELVSYLTLQPVVGCLENFLWDFDDNLANAFTDANMQTVLSGIRSRASDYDGTNGSALHQLWFFIRVGYFHEFFEPAVTDFDAATLSAHVAAANAFAANPRIYDFNDEAALILAEWFAAADQEGVRQNHLTQVVRILTTLTPERAASAVQLQAYNSVFFLLFRGIANSDAAFIDVVGRDPDIVDALLQAALYEFLDPEALYLLENATRELGRLAGVPTLRDSVVTALASVLTTYERLSSPFLLAAESLEEHADCQPFEVCREDLETDIIDRVFPHTYLFDDGTLVFQTSLDLETVQPLYHAAKQVEAQFYRLLELDRAVADDANDVLYIKLYGSLAEYGQFQGYLTTVPL